MIKIVHVNNFIDIIFRSSICVPSTHVCVSFGFITFNYGSLYSNKEQTYAKSYLTSQKTYPHIYDVKYNFSSEKKVKIFVAVVYNSDLLSVVTHK